MNLTTTTTTTTAKTTDDDVQQLKDPSSSYLKLEGIAENV